MNRTEFEALGTKQKDYEFRSRSYLHEGLFTVVRLDGRAFHTFTAGLTKPFSLELISIMEEVTKSLVSHFHAVVGYVQSDEITLVFSNYRTLMFNGVRDKIISILAGHASAVFNKEVAVKLPSKSNVIAVFDARVVQFANVDDVVKNLMWRETDATRNSLSMLAQAHFSPSQLHKKSAKTKHDMLHEIGINWNDLEPKLKRGSYFSRVSKVVELTEEQLSKIPEKNRPATNTVMRTVVERLDLEPLEIIVGSGDVASIYEILC